MSEQEAEAIPTLAGKIVQVTFPHIGYRKVVRVITTYYGMSQNKWLVTLVQAGILSAIEENEKLSAAIKQVSPSLWEEITEMGQNESGRANQVPSEATGRG